MEKFTKSNLGFISIFFLRVSVGVFYANTTVTIKRTIKHTMSMVTNLNKKNYFGQRFAALRSSNLYLNMV